jgi:rhodanese-related sulfurtransferase
MKTFALVAALALTVPVAGCNKQEASSQSQAAQIAEISVDELAKLVESGKAPAIFDANNAETREKYGVVPGAKLLTSSSDFQASELPGDKAQKLVFYCGSTKCTAAEGAAKKAAVAGYSDIAVMKAGIRGWAEAGKPTSKI